VIKTFTEFIPLCYTVALMCIHNSSTSKIVMLFYHTSILSWIHGHVSWLQFKYLGTF